MVELYVSLLFRSLGVAEFAGFCSNVLLLKPFGLVFLFSGRVFEGWFMDAVDDAGLSERIGRLDVWGCDGVV